MITYLRSSIDSLKATNDKSLQYWRARARQIFLGRKDVNSIFVFRSGSKKEAIQEGKLFLGAKNSRHGECVILASTGGKWGKSRKNYFPAFSAN